MCSATLGKIRLGECFISIRQHLNTSSRCMLLIVLCGCWCSPQVIDAETGAQRSEEMGLATGLASSRVTF